LAGAAGIAAAKRPSQHSNEDHTAMAVRRPPGRAVISLETRLSEGRTLRRSYGVRTKLAIACRCRGSKRGLAFLNQ
jgi:hypothetical protein